MLIRRCDVIGCLPGRPRNIPASAYYSTTAQRHAMEGKWGGMSQRLLSLVLFLENHTRAATVLLCYQLAADAALPRDVLVYSCSWLAWADLGSYGRKGLRACCQTVSCVKTTELVKIVCNDRSSCDKISNFRWLLFASFHLWIIDNVSFLIAKNKTVTVIFCFGMNFISVFIQYITIFAWKYLLTKI